MEKDLRNLLKIPSDRLDSINSILLDPGEQVINDFLKIVVKYGTPEIAKFAETGKGQKP
jgi:hypothetical protein